MKAIKQEMGQEMGQVQPQSRSQGPIPGQMKKMHKHHKGLKLVPASKGHKPKGAHGRAAVHALGRTKTTGNFARIEKSKGKGAAINAFQNALKAHRAGKR